MLTKEEKAERLEQRRELKRKAKKAAQEQAEKSQKHVASLKINIEWKKSYMWGNNPHAEAWATYKDGTSEYANSFTASGCGYCKESTVIAEIFNRFLKYKLYQRKRKAKKPYGCRVRGIDNWTYSPNYSGGVGTSCYYNIAEYIGGKFEHVASGKTFDSFRYTDSKRCK